MDLRKLGWNETLESEFITYKEDGYIAARVSSEFKHMYRLISEHGDLTGEISGKLRHLAVEREDYPAVGDWVVIKPRLEDRMATIHAILPRNSKISRKVAGNNTDEQIIATNLNTILLVTALNNDFNLRRLERYLTVAWESGANPIIVLSKSDLCDDLDSKIMEVEAISFGVPVIAISSVAKTGFDKLKTYLKVGETIALIGSSGVGKSTLINELYGSNIQEIKETRTGDDRGKHTTTNRELILLPEGGVIIDTPGMRELQLWETDLSMSDTFKEIEELANQCYFRDCKHEGEPNCAVKEAIDNGSLDISRYRNFKKMQKELAYLERRERQKAKLQDKSEKKRLMKNGKAR